MAWWNVLPVFAGSIVIVFGPGLVLAYFVGARGLSLIGLAPLLTVAIVGVAGIAAEIIGLPWSILPVILTTLGATACVWALSTFVWRSTKPRPERASHYAWAGAAVGLALGAFFIGRRLFQVIGSPENFAQRFDNVFHLNAIQYIIQSGHASSLTLGRMVGAEGAGAIYPSAWHSIGALIAQLSGADVVVAENASNIVIAAVVWPVTMMFLVYSIVGPRPVALALAGAFSAGYAAFPISIMDFGPLYPNILAYALLPAAVAIVIALCGLAYKTSDDATMLWMLIVLAIPGLALSQTNGLLALAAFALVLGLWAVWRQFRKLRGGSSQRRQLIKLGAHTVLGLVLFGAIWKLLRPLVEYDGWAPFTTQAGAVGEAVVNGAIGRPATWAVSILALIGIHRVLLNTSKLWIFLCWLVPVTLYVTTASSPKGFWRTLLTGGWYQDSYRLAALLPIFSIVLAVVGSLFLWETFSARLMRSAVHFTRSRKLKPSAMTAATALFFVLALAVASQFGTMRPITEEARRAYVMDSNAPIIDSDELALINRLSKTVPSNEVVAVNPWNGGALAYALSGRKVTAYHMFTADDFERKKIDEGIGTATRGSAICDIANRRNIHYILDFGSTYLANSAAANSFPGLVDVKESPSVDVVDSQGKARLLRISCG